MDQLATMTLGFSDQAESYLPLPGQIVTTSTHCGELHVVIRDPLSLLVALDPHMYLTGFVTGLDVNDARPAAHRTILRVRLPLSAAEIDRQLVSLSAERTGYRGRALAIASTHTGLSLARPTANGAVLG